MSNNTEFDKSPDQADEYLDLLRRAEKAERELATLKEQSRWIPVSERLPGKKDDVIIAPIEKDGVIVCFGGTWIHYNFTHWRPLPSLPEDV